MATTTSWKGGDGNWQTAAKWTAGAPTASSFAVINAAGTYTINIGSGQEYHVGSVSLNDAGATLAVAGILTLQNRLTLFKGALDLSGTIEGGSIAAQGGSIAFLGGTLDNVDYRGTLNLETSGTLTIMNGMTLHGANGSGKGAIAVGVGSHLILSGTQTLNNATLTIDGGSFDIQNGTLTFGPAMTVLYTSSLNAFTQSSSTIVNKGNVQLAGGSQSTFSGTVTNSGKFSLAAGSTTQFVGALNNSGQFTAASGASITTNNLVNSGQFIVAGNANTKAPVVAQISNTGAVTIKQGGTLNASEISNSGRVVLTGGSMDVTGEFDIRAAGRVTLFAGSKLTVTTLNNAGALTANGATLDLGNASNDTFGKLTISNSTVSVTSYNPDDDDALISALANQNNQLTINGYFNNNTGKSLDLTVPDGFKSFTYSGSITGGTVEIAPGAFTGSLTNLTVKGPVTVNTGSLTLINVVLTGADGTGAGAVNLNDSTLVLPGKAHAAGLDNVDIVSTETSGISSYDPNVPRHQRNTPFNFTLGADATVTSNGNFTISLTKQYIVQPLNVTNNGTLQENGPGTFEVSSDYFYNNGTVDVGNGGKFVIDSKDNTLEGSGVFDISANSTLEAKKVTLLTAKVDLEGAGATFDCAGLTVIYGGGALTIGTGAVVDIGSTMTILGALNLEGSSVTTTKFMVNGGGVLGGYGKVVGAVVNSGTIDASGGGLTISQDVTGTGQITIEDTSALAVDGNVSAGQTVTFESASGRLGLAYAAGFAATIAGFAAGDVIRLIDTAATGLTYNAAKDTLTIKNKGALVATLQLSGDYTGDTFHLASDGKGGTQITVSASSAGVSRFVEAIAASAPSDMASLAAAPASLNDNAVQMLAAGHA